ncbi:MAG TPA: hypothetical protein QGF58_06420 [Myxococcota bacterium]|nr:hypothetical protein [Myxococcota bacterium]
MSTTLLMFSISFAGAVDFEVGAGAELVGSTTPGAIDGGLGHAEIDAFLDLDVAAVVVDLDLLGPASVGVDRVGGELGVVYPEWAAVLATTGRWDLAAGFQPLPAGAEAVDAWRNPLVTNTRGMSTLWLGGMLGARANVALDAPVTPSMWGGVLAPTTVGLGEPVLGGGVQFGYPDRVHGHVAVHTLPTLRDVRSHAALIAPLRDVVTLSGEVHAGYAKDLAFGVAGTAVAIPGGVVSPVVRVEHMGSLAVDAGVLAQPHEAFRVLASGRVEEGGWGLYASVSLVDERPQPDLWALR